MTDLLDITTRPIGEASQRVTVREPSHGLLSVDIGEVWRYRELLQLLVWRNIMVRYKQSVAGIGWALFRPLIQMAIFTIIFGRVAKLPTPGNMPYMIVTLTALLPWTYFASSLTAAGGSLVDAAGVATKVYFPRLLLPLSNLFAGLVDFAIAFVMLIAVVAWQYRDPSTSINVTWRVVCLPLFLLYAAVAALAVSLWLSAFMVKYRDVKHLLPFLVQCWQYASPVAYWSGVVPERWRLLYFVNPMAGVAEGFRWSLLGAPAPHWQGFGISIVITLALLLTGLCYFRRTERVFADIV